MSVKAKQVTLLPTNSLTKSYGSFAAAANISCVASGNGAHAEGGSSRAGQLPNTFTIPAGGTLVTIAGDQRAQYDIGETVRIVPFAPKALPARSGVILDVPAFSAGNTTFNLTAPIDTTTTAGEIVECSLVGFGRGQFAHSEGRSCIAEGFCSSAKGATSLAYGVAGTAEGAFGWSFGHGAHAEGEVCVAGGTDSHSEGIGNTTMGTGAHAEGAGSAGRWVGSVAGGHGSHAEGSFTRAGNNLLPFTIVPGGTLVTIPGNVVSQFNIGDVRIPFLPLVPQMGAILYGTVADQPVFAAGNTTFHIVDPLSVIGPLDAPGVGLVCSGGYTCGTGQGVAAHSEGISTIASCSASHAQGQYTKAFGVASHTEGSETVCLGDKTHAEGEFSIASGINAHAEGKSTLANASISHAEGSGTRCGNFAQTFTIAAGGITVTIAGNVTSQFTNGQSVDINPTTPTATNRLISTLTVATVPAFAAGNTTLNLSGPIDAYTTGGTIVNPNVGIYAHAEGYQTVATGNRSHAEGDRCITSALGAHAEGGTTTASGVNSHAEGINTVASGSDSHAEGNGCIASVIHSHAEGDTTTSSGFASHSQGGNTTASGPYCHAEGYAGSAIGSYSRVQGAEAKALRQYRCAEAYGQFSAIGDNQTERTQIRGSTPGVAAGETTLMRPGITGTYIQVTLDNLTSYAVTIKAIARKMATGAATPQDAYFNITFIASVNNAGVVTFSPVTNVIPPILNGAAFVGATLVPSTSGGPNDFSITFSIAAGLTIASRITASMEMVELVGT